MKEARFRNRRRPRSNPGDAFISAPPLHGRLVCPETSPYALALRAQLPQESSDRFPHDPGRLRIAVAADEMAGDGIDPHRARLGDGLEVGFDGMGRPELVLRTDDEQRPRLDRA